ncbi:MAG: hypothetical protein ACJ79S_01180 [Gemmatimonadaceae bacterium]
MLRPLRLRRRLVEALDLADPPPPKLPRAHRLLTAVAIGAIAGAFCGLALARQGGAPDFLVFWYHARTLLAGGNPYLHPLHVSAGRDAPFLYPLPAAMLVAPFAWLPMPLAGALFFGLSSALLAYGVTRDGWHRLLLFPSGPFILAATLGQWSPLVTAAAVLPWLGGAAVAKPNIGLALAAYRPTWRGAVGAFALVVASLALVPRWPLDWLHLVGTQHAIYHAPVATFGGVLLLLSLVRWRLPGARLLAVLACIPHMLFFYDQLPLWLIPRTWRESLLLTVSSLLAWLGWVATLRPGVVTNDYIPAAQPYVTFGVFLPALLIVLWQRPRHPVSAAWRATDDGATRAEGAAT